MEGGRRKNEGEDKVRSAKVTQPTNLLGKCKLAGLSFSPKPLLKDGKHLYLNFRNFQYLPLMRITIFLLFICLAFGCNRATKQSSPKSPPELSRNIGDTFSIDGLVDTAGNPVDLNLSHAELTVVDFWFTECPPCIKEMQQFADLLKGKEGKVQVVSVSINQPWYWMEAIQGKNQRLTFLKMNVSNWRHVAMTTKDDPKFRNSMSTERIRSLENRYSVSFYPAYFVLDRNGKILKRPHSAVEFLKTL